MLQDFINVFTAPTQHFAGLKARPSILPPLLVLLGLAIFTQYWAMVSIDFDYFIEQMVRDTAMRQDVPESQIREGLSMMTPSMMGTLAAASTAIILLLIFCAAAAYFTLVSKLSDDRAGFRHFFSLVCWASMPLALTYLGVILVILFSHEGQVSPAQLSPLSLSNLGLSATGSTEVVLQQVDLMTLWSSALSVLGYRQLTDTSWTRAVVIVLLPVVVIIGIITAIVFF